MEQREESETLIRGRLHDILSRSLTACRKLNTTHPWTVIAAVLCVNTICGGFAVFANNEIRLHELFLPDGSQSEIDKTFLSSVTKDYHVYERQLISVDEKIEIIYSSGQWFTSADVVNSYTLDLSNIFAATCPTSSRISHVPCSGLESVIILRSYLYSEFYLSNDSFINYPFVYSLEENRWVYSADHIHGQDRMSMTGVKWTYYPRHLGEQHDGGYRSMIDNLNDLHFKPSVYSEYQRDETLYEDFKDATVQYIGVFFMMNGLAIGMIMSNKNSIGKSVLLLCVQTLSSIMALLSGIGIGSLLGYKINTLILSLLPIFTQVMGLMRLFLQTSKFCQHRSSTTSVSITLSYVFELSIVTAGMLSSLAGVRHASLYLGASGFIGFLNQMTFIPACINVFDRLLGCLSFANIPTHRRENRLLEKSVIFHKTHEFALTGEIPKLDKQAGGHVEKGFKVRLSSIISGKYFQFVILLVVLLYLRIMARYTAAIEFRDTLPRMGSETSNIREFFDEDQNFEQTTLISFTIHEPIQYTCFLNKQFIDNIITDAQMDPNIHDTYSINWLDAYKGSNAHDFRYNDSNESAFAYNLYHTKSISNYEGDYQVENESGPVLFSRFYVLAVNLTDSKVKSDLMSRMRMLAANSPLPVKVFTPDFIKYEQHLAIITGIVKTIAIPITCLLFTMCYFFPFDILSIVYIAGSTFVTVLSIFGSMSILTIHYNFVTMLPVMAISIISTSVSVLVCFEHAQRSHQGNSFQMTKIMKQTLAHTLKPCLCVLIGLVSIFETSSYILYCIAWIFAAGMANILLQYCFVFPLLISFFN